MAWWASALETTLSQGDIVTQIPVSVVAFPVRFLNKRTGKGGAHNWQESDMPEGDQRYLLSRGDRQTIVVISHSCELDKVERKGRVLVASVKSADGLEAAVRTQVYEQRRLSLLPLPAVPTLGDCYADLRVLQPVDRQALEVATRVASMSPDGVRRLQEQVVGFIARTPAAPG